MLILRQFLTPEGEQLPRKITGLCPEQHKEVKQMVRQAMRAGSYLKLLLILKKNIQIYMQLDI